MHCILPVHAARITNNNYAEAERQAAPMYMSGDNSLDSRRHQCGRQATPVWATGDTCSVCVGAWQSQRIWENTATLRSNYIFCQFKFVIDLQPPAILLLDRVLLCWDKIFSGVFIEQHLAILRIMAVATVPCI